MKLEVKVHPGAKKAKLTEGEPLEVWLTEKPEGGRANRALIGVLAEHFSVPRSSVTIIRGQTSRRKLVEIRL